MDPGAAILRGLVHVPKIGGWKNQISVGIVGEVLDLDRRVEGLAVVRSGKPPRGGRIAVVEVPGVVVAGDGSRDVRAVVGGTVVRSITARIGGDVIIGHLPVAGTRGGMGRVIERPVLEVDPRISRRHRLAIPGDAVRMHRRGETDRVVALNRPACDVVQEVGGRLPVDPEDPLFMRQLFQGGTRDLPSDQARSMPRGTN